MKKRVLATLMATVMVISLLAGCQTKPAEEPAAAPEEKKEEATENTAEEKPAEGEAKEKVRIGISLVYKGDEWCAAVDDEFKKQAEDFGFEVNVQDGNVDNETQLKHIEDFISQQYDVIAIDAASAEGILPGIQKALDAGIPVIAYDSPTDSDEVITFVSWDNYATGNVLGKHIRETIEKDFGGKANIGVLTMSSPISISERINGFKDAMEGLDITYVSEQDYEGNREKAANIVTNIKEPMDFIVSGQDNGAWGAVSALQALNNTTTMVYSMGAYGDEPFDALIENNLPYKGTVAISPFAIVTATYQAIEDHLNGKELPPRIDIDLDLVTPENIKEYLGE